MTRLLQYLKKVNMGNEAEDIARETINGFATEIA